MPDNAAHGRKPSSAQPERKPARHIDWSPATDSADFEQLTTSAPLVSSAPLSSSAILGLQRTIGNRATQRLIARRNARKQPAPRPFYPVKAVQHSAGEHIQRYAFIGANKNYTQYKVKPGDSQKIRNMARDMDTRRFRDEAEMRAFAAGTTEHVGPVPEKQMWARLDQFTVLGESHGEDANAKPLVKGLKVRRFRYEGFVHMSKTRLKKSQDLRDQVTQTKAQGNPKYGLGATDDTAPHEAEHILPKYARALPDASTIFKWQTGQNPDVHGQSLRPGDAWNDQYSLPKALHKSTLDAMIYASSYAGKVFAHPLKKFYNDNATAVQTAITGMQTADAQNVLPDYTAIGLMGFIDDMAAAYKTAAMSKFSMTDRKLNEWIGKLNTRKEPQVTVDPDAKEMDYLRDYSMYKTIQKAKSRDLLYVLGGAHLHKLKPLLDADGIVNMTFEDYTAEQKAEDAAANPFA